MGRYKVIPDEAFHAADATYRDTILELRLAEGGGFKVASQQRRALRAALEAAAPHLSQPEPVSSAEVNAVAAMVKDAYERGWGAGFRDRSKETK
jgi:hypothetical protein